MSGVFPAVFPADVRDVGVLLFSWRACRECGRAPGLCACVRVRAAGLPG